MEHNVDWEQRIDFDKLRKERLNHLKEGMVQHGLDAILSFSTDHIRYITCFRPLYWSIPTHSLTRQAAIFVPGKDPVLFVTGPDYPRAHSTMNWLPSDHIQTIYHMELLDDVKKAVKGQFQPFLSQLGVNAGRVGIEVATPMILDELRKAMPKIKWVDSNDFFREVKFIKNSEEIKCLRLAAVCADIGHDQAMRSIKVGARECEVLGRAMGRMYDFGMEVSHCSEMVASGEHSAPLYRLASDKPIVMGDLVFIDLGACINGYFSDVTRTYITGKPSDLQKRIYTAVYDIIMAVHEYMKPGNTNIQVINEMKKRTAKHGFDTSDALVRYTGHAIGISGNEAPRVHDDTAFEFKPGMVFACEPGIYVDGVPGGGGVRIEDNILITEKGNEILNRTPYCEKLLGNRTCGGPCETCCS